MLFNSFIFFIFLGVVLPVFYLLPNKRSKSTFLVLASYVFYGYWDWRFCSLLAISTIVDFLIGRALFKTEEQKKRKLLLLASIFANLSILGFFKYYNFFVDSFQMFSQNLGWNVDYLHLNILLPVGISFYTFQTLSYTIDVYRKRLTPTNNFIDFALYVAFFPQLVAGPIERAKSLLPQLSKKLKPNREQIKQGIVLIIFGLFRKVMIGDTAGRYVDHIFANVGQFKSIELVAAVVLFTIQVYADFSGYSHIARGTAKLLGVELIKNFEQPYLSRNITEFWRRWHISLSTWLKDYVYISLGGNRKGKFRTYANLMLTMLIGGLWHGPSWSYVIWGGFHGLCLAIHKLTTSKAKAASEKIEKLNLQNVLSVVLTFILILFTMFLFRSPSWSSTLTFFSKMIYWESSEYALLFVSISLSYLIMTLLFDLFEYTTGKHTYLLDIKSNGIKIGVLTAMLTVTFIYMFQSDPQPFVYFQF